MFPSSTQVKRIGGIDEAGRGSVIGPLVVCGVVIEESDLTILREIGVRDSKTLTSLRRQLLSKEIRQIARTVLFRTISAAEIDRLRLRGVNLNRIELMAFADITREMNAQRVHMDSPDVLPYRFEQDIRKANGLSIQFCDLVAAHKADSIYPVVSAASIVAKVERDQIVERLHHEYGDFGSGYPSDPKTVNFILDIIKNGLTMPDIVRQTWRSIDNIRRKT